jgi:hypothetical protein
MYFYTSLKTTQKRVLTRLNKRAGGGGIEKMRTKRRNNNLNHGGFILIHYNLNHGGFILIHFNNCILIRLLRLKRTLDIFLLGRPPQKSGKTSVDNP